MSAWLVARRKKKITRYIHIKETIREAQGIFRMVSFMYAELL